MPEVHFGTRREKLQGVGGWSSVSAKPCFLDPLSPIQSQKYSRCASLTGSPMQVLFLYPSVPDTQNLQHELKTFSLRIESSQVGSLVHPVIFPLSLRPLGQTSPQRPASSLPIPLRGNRSYLAWSHPCVHHLLTVQVRVLPNGCSHY